MVAFTSLPYSGLPHWSCCTCVEALIRKDCLVASRLKSFSIRNPHHLRMLGIFQMWYDVICSRTFFHCCTDKKKTTKRYSATAFLSKKMAWNLIIHASMWTVAHWPGLDFNTACIDLERCTPSLGLEFNTPRLNLDCFTPLLGELLHQRGD